jgi:hypothetical protein
MKYIRKYNEELEISIEHWCKLMHIHTYTIKNDSLNVNGDVIARGKGLYRIPIKFDIVTGFLDLSHNRLYSLNGCPDKVFRGFSCASNLLTTLKGGPNEVYEAFSCTSNLLTTLEGGPSEVGGNYYCRNNELISLEGCPLKVKDNIECEGNPIHQIYKLFLKHEFYIESLDQNYFRPGKKIVKGRFIKALHEVYVNLPNLNLITEYEFI